MIADGNEWAFRQLYDHYHQRIYSIGYYFTQSDAIAQDITQDVFLKFGKKETN
ncbi:RNA polymerase sigma factor [Niabella ginsengisoli]|uniref:RNA polymerase sigma-70 region 2 domain-containing protein n=1 Tax=Niabella ginsengisoli TaxID=522298 RepID=A0ABS9SET1_9BACT|nr:sigma factor [Niabella ginsengisoli]MCH5596874.1 hypothetical protein [Niabella ginsengisoli]